MICVICKKQIRMETNWNSLFQFKVICEQCKIIMEEEPTYERVPITSGYIDMCQLFPKYRPDFEILPQFFSKYKYPLSLVLKDPDSYQIILYFDEAERLFFDSIMPYLLPFKTILLITLSSHSLLEIMME